MRNVKLNKTELLDIVRKNKEKHVADYKESVQDYCDAALKIAQANLKLAKTGEMSKISDMQDMPHEPSSYEASYSRAIRMLELSVEEIIELDETTFNQLVLDEWSWKSSFTQTSTLYKSIK